MKDSQPNMEIDAVIRAAMEMTDVPAPELNQKLKRRCINKKLLCKSNLLCAKYPYGICQWF